MESLSSAKSLDMTDWQAVTIWAITTYGLMQFLAMNTKETFAHRQSKINNLQTEFASTYFIPQDDSAMKKAFDAFDGTFGVSNDNNGAAAKRMDKKANKKKKSLLDGKLRDVVEMAYWLVKFVGDYEKLYSKTYLKDIDVKTGSSADLVKEEKPFSLIGPNTRSLVAFSRYFLKYLGSFEKLFYFANKL